LKLSVPILLVSLIIQNFSTDTQIVIAQNVGGALHLTDALHRKFTFETRTATHPNADAVQFYHHEKTECLC